MPGGQSSEIRIHGKGVEGQIAVAIQQHRASSAYSVFEQQGEQTAPRHGEKYEGSGGGDGVETDLRSASQQSGWYQGAQ
ncbi:hypothetical protein D3C72_1960410 [compost metagenome]